jgi:hypothetical protein
MRSLHLHWNSSAALALGLSGVFMWASCKNGPVDPPIPEPAAPVVTLSAEMMNQGEALGLNEVFFDDKDCSGRLVVLKYYLAHIDLKRDDGSYHRCADIELFDHKVVNPNLTTPQWSNQYAYEVPEGNYTALRFGLGVPGDLNGIDPSSYDNADPLSTYSNMYWSWASMYRFIILEAKLDTAGGASYDFDVVFHTGLDSLYRDNIELPVIFSIAKGDTQTITLEIDWNTLFYGDGEEIHLTQEHVTHTTDNAEEFDLARRFTDRFVGAIQVR